MATSTGGKKLMNSKEKNEIITNLKLNVLDLEIALSKAKYQCLFLEDNDIKSTIESIENCVTELKSKVEKLEQEN